MLFACIYVPEFPVQALARTAPELRDLAVAVLDGTPPLLSVIAANPKARVAGVEVGMTKLHAEACFGVQLRRRSLAQEEAAQHALLDCAYAFSPRVETKNRHSTNATLLPGDTVIVDITGLDRLFGPPAKVARGLASRTTKVGLAANVAVAGNPDAAMHAAHGFAGVTVIVPGTEAKRLATLPISLLEPSPEKMETLARWGIRDFGGLAGLPEVALSQRLGQEGLRLQKLARGSVERTIVPTEPTIKFEEAIELEDTIELLEPLVFVLNRLLEQICARLLSRALAANELRLTLEITGHEDQSLEEQAASRRLHQRAFQFPVPMHDSRTFLKLLQLDLAAHPPGGPVKKIVIAAESAPPRFGQAGLFLPKGPAPERLELTLARLRGIAGDDRVGSAELLDTHAPDAFRMRPFRAQNISGIAEKWTSMGRPRTQRTALRIFRPPLEAKVQTKSGVSRGRESRAMRVIPGWRCCAGCR